MPGCTLHLVALSSSSSISTVISLLKPPSEVQVLLIAKVIRWVIIPTKLSVSDLLHPPKPYDLFIVTNGTNPLPGSITSHLAFHWSIPAGIPSRLVSNFSATNEKLLHPRPSDVVPLTGALQNPRVSSNSQDLSLSPELRSWVDSFSKAEGRGAVSMLNLLAFAPNMKDSYLVYGGEFAKNIGARRGGNAKLVGNVIGKQDGWDEIAVAHYPSILHFADMLASEDYQDINQKYRVPALRDTCILCTSEIALEQDGLGLGGKAKL